MFSRFFMVIILCGLLVGCQPNATSKSDSNTELRPVVEQVVPTKKDQQVVLEQFAAKAEKVYKGAISGETIQVREEIAQIELMLKQIPLGQLTSVEGIRALTNTIIETKRTVNAVSLNPDRWLLTTAKMRLAVDALVNAKHGLWTQYYKAFIEDMDQLEAAAKAPSKEKFASAFRGLQQHYELIRPAVIIVHPADFVEKFDSYVSFLQTATQAEPFQGQQASEAISIGKPLIQELFMKRTDKPTFVPPVGTGQDPWIWIVGIGAVVVTVLTYVGFRKYQYEQELARQKKLRNRTDRNK
ncbi:sporulation protein YpjB [Paenibacillus terrigena]|uniref:sporulation protein YpjB n=1 Tax=Paenibacillus terrigena TaxID=369333 RepID=UPI000363FC95|nr:sporulation protein YpjB [Paenibacillus terrigena]